MISTLKEKRKPKKAAAANVKAKVTTKVQAEKARRDAEARREWARYQKNQDPSIRRRLLNRYLPLVRNVAGRMAINFPRSVELCDLINTGVIGLTEAFRKFDPDRGVKFETYAVPRIRGAILDELRSLDWVPRSTRAKAREIERALLVFENKEGRAPTDEELAKMLNIGVQDLHYALEDVSKTTLLSLDEMIFREDDNRQVPRIETVEDKKANTTLKKLERSELQAFLVLAIDRLTEQEKLVIALYYYEELTLKEIGEVMKISESRVSQIHTKAVLKLRGMVREKFGLA
ncbi:MAG: FliA/WhiG family RNA polymerase sigma factor [candidate division Zixibacteria bacterium]|nr:FliA/WhiG family RNA polymerase sigma factor [candidate division Zixibacteria bacterium]